MQEREKKSSFYCSSSRPGNMQEASDVGLLVLCCFFPCWLLTLSDTFQHCELYTVMSYFKKVVLSQIMFYFFHICFKELHFSVVD